MLSPRHGQALADGLKQNNTLEKLWLQRNSIGDAGAQVPGEICGKGKVWEMLFFSQVGTYHIRIHSLQFDVLYHNFWRVDFCHASIGLI